MIWIDSSFAVEWLLGTDRAAQIDLAGEQLTILPMQYAETFIYLMKNRKNPLKIAGELEIIELKNPDKIHLQQGASLYLSARAEKSKASLADAILAAVACERKEKMASFDHDFKYLGMKEQNGLWSVA